MRSSLIGVIAAIAACLVWGAVPATAIEPSGDEAAPMYGIDTVDAIALTLPQGSIDALEAEPEGDYQPGTFSLATSDGTPDGIGAFSPPIDVGIRLKGGTGSFRPLSGKAALKIKFSFVKGQKFLGLKKLTLNNMVQDPSMIHEALAYRSFRSAGVPASRTGYAYVRINGLDYGLHLNIENVDDVALEKRFGPFKKPPQHLYEGEYGDDVSAAAGGAAAFEVDEGEEAKREDLEALIAAVNGAAPDWSDAVAPVADLEEMTRMWAIEKYSGHWDGYSGEASRPGVPLPNNYYLYSDPLGRFRMLPWGTDQTWDRTIAFDGKAGLLFNLCLGDASCARLYRDALRAAQGTTGADNLDSLAGALAKRLRPWQELEQSSPRHEDSLAEIDAAVQGTRDFIAARPAALTAWLRAHTKAEHLSLVLQPGPLLADGSATTTATATVTDGDDQPRPEEAVTLASSDPGQRIGPVVDNGDGTYSARITSSTTVGVATITATDTSVTPRVSGTARLEQVALPKNSDSAAAAGPAPTKETAPPTASFTHRPPQRGPGRGPSFVFVSDQPGSTFSCKLDGRKYQPCSSPAKLSRLALGPHAFRAIATSPAGVPGPAAVAKFTIERR